tara:strand:+ start:33 stop:299 length:267 start_codon:yes stop_codon:yes gene_type:complete
VAYRIKSIKNNIAGNHLKINSIIFNFLLFQFLDKSKFLSDEENNNVKQLNKENATITFANELSVTSIKSMQEEPVIQTNLKRVFFELV